jgi:hypothetical protein
MDGRGSGEGAASGLGRRRLNRERKERGRRGRRRGLTGGATLSVSAGKRKRGGAELGCCGRGLMGRWVAASSKGCEVSFYFFSNSFQIKPFQFKFKPKLFKSFTKFYKPF